MKVTNYDDTFLKTKLRITKVAHGGRKLSCAITQPICLLSSADFQLFYSIRRRNLDHGKTAVLYSTPSQHSLKRLEHASDVLK
jgi:hypothetical protein